MKTFFTSFGFLLFIVGMLALVLSLVGIRFSFLSIIDQFGHTIGFLLKLAMIFAGIIMIVLAQTDWKSERNL